MPGPGDRLSLVRHPENPHDGNAGELWWRNRYQLGHLPRDVVADVAGRMDAGEALRAYVLDLGNGKAWSLRVLLVGRACENLHGCRIEAWAAREAVRHLSKYGSKYGSPKEDEWGRNCRRIAWSEERRPPTERHAAAAEAWEARRRLASDCREPASAAPSRGTGVGNRVGASLLRNRVSPQGERGNK